MFDIARTEHDEIVIMKKGFRGGSITLAQNDLIKFIEWLNAGNRRNFSSHSLQVYPEGNSLSLHGLGDSELTIERKDIPALSAALDGIASTKLPDKLAPEPSTSGAELTDEEEVSQFLDERKVSTKERRLIQTISPQHSPVFRIAYVQCAGCHTELRLEHRDNYAGQALQCPQCSQILLLKD